MVPPVELCVLGDAGEGAGRGRTAFEVVPDKEEAEPAGVMGLAGPATAAAGLKEGG